MKTVGIIAEYNPFHLGHKYLIEESKMVTDASRVVVVMSGNSVQRGDFAIVDKFARAKEAILGGADLVLELPFCYSSQSAEFFAKGGVNILHSSGLVDYLCYGSENNNTDAQWRIANLLQDEPAQLSQEIKAQMKTGLSFPRARQIALEKLYPNEADYSIMNSPNDVLAIEYIKTLYRLVSTIEPVSIQRIGGSYYDPRLEIEVPSATAIREGLIKGKGKNFETQRIYGATTTTMADYLMEQKNNKSLGSIEDYLLALKTIILRDKQELANIFEVREGIENLLSKKAVFVANSVHDLAILLNNKRYTYTSAKRMLMNILVGLSKEDMEIVKTSEERPYARILAFNDQGREMIKEIHQNLVLINKPADFQPQSDLHKVLFKYDEIVNQLYYLTYVYEHYGKRVQMDAMTSPVYVK